MYNTNMYIHMYVRTYVHTYMYIGTYVHMNIIYYVGLKCAASQPHLSTWGLKKKSFQSMTYKMILHSKCGSL